MDSQVDLEARERIAHLERKHQELSSAFWGDEVRRDNGLRSDVKALEVRSTEFEKKFLDAMAWAKHLWEVDREADCHGLKALAAYEAERQDCREEENEVQVAEINARAALEVAAKNYKSAVRGQIITIIGLVLVAAIQLLAR